MTAVSASPAISAEFVARLAERAQEAEQMRRLPPDTVADLVESGFTELLVPARYGGRQAAFPAILDPVRRMAHGCASSPCTIGFYALHNWMLGAVRRARAGGGLCDASVPRARSAGADGPGRPDGRRRPADRPVVVGHRGDARQLDHRRRAVRT